MLPEQRRRRLLSHYLHYPMMLISVKAKYSCEHLSWLLFFVRRHIGQNIVIHELAWEIIILLVRKSSKRITLVLFTTDVHFFQVLRQIFQKSEGLKEKKPKCRGEVSCVAPFNIPLQKPIFTASMRQFGFVHVTFHTSFLHAS